MARRRRPRKVGGAADLALYKALVGAARRAKPRRRRAKYGAGFFGDLWSGVKSVIPSVARTIGSAIKDPVALAAGKTLGAIDPRLGQFAQKGIYDLGDKFGFARRRKRGGAKMSSLVLSPGLGLARRRPRRRVGMAKRRVVRRKVGGSYARLV